MKKLVFPCMVSLGLWLSSCGGDSAQNQTGQQVTESSVAESDLANATEIELVINAGDDMKFDKKELKAYEGQKIQLTLHHTGKMSKDQMGHNWVLLQAGTDPGAFGAQAMSAKSEDYVPASLKDQVIVSSELIGGGQQTTVSFDAPPAGEYTYICSFPGHYGIMKGKLVILSR